MSAFQLFLRLRRRRLLRFLVLGDEPSNGTGADLQVDAACAGQGATIEEIERALPTPPKRGTLLYWLSALMSQKQIIFDGTRYRLAQTADAGLSPNAAAPDATVTPPLAPSASSVAPVPASEPTLPVAKSDAPAAPVLPAAVDPPVPSNAPAPVAQPAATPPPVKPAAVPPGVTVPASAGATPASADPHRFDDLFEDGVTEIIPKQLSKVAAVMCLRDAAREEPTARAGVRGPDHAPEPEATGDGAARSHSPFNIERPRVR